MATEQGFVEHLQTQSGLGAALSFRKMFGEYALYLQGKVVAFACANQLYLKPTAPGRALLGSPCEAAPYPGGKLWFLIDEQLEDRDLLGRLFRVTADALPLPEPKRVATAGRKRAASKAPARRNKASAVK
jgi:TfoX/Sxy family transcriptional regulator of competence genes